METKQMKFKTNIKCDGCIATVKPHLDGVAGIKEWGVDIADNDKILTVASDTLSEKEIISIVQTAGYKAEQL